MGDDVFMRRAVAIALANLDNPGGGPFGAVVVHNGEIVGEGANEVTSSNDPSAHAEIVAIRAACARLEAFHIPDCDIYTSCEPCPMCLGAIYWARLRRIYYANTRTEAAEAGFDDDFIYRELALPPHARTIPAVQLTTSDSSAPFAAWAAKPDKLRY